MTQDDLYQQAILEHARREAPLPEGAAHRASLDNPFCGDAVTVAARLEDGRVAEVGYEVEGCAIARASAAMMVDAVRGLGAAEIEALRAGLGRLIAGEPGSMGALDALSGVARYPVRRRCATLPWEALAAALSPRGS